MILDVTWISQHTSFELEAFFFLFSPISFVIREDLRIESGTIIFHANPQRLKCSYIHIYTYTYFGDSKEDEEKAVMGMARAADGGRHLLPCLDDLGEESTSFSRGDGKLGPACELSCLAGVMVC